MVYFENTKSLIHHILVNILIIANMFTLGNTFYMLLLADLCLLSAEEENLQKIINILSFHVYLYYLITLL